MEFLCGAQFSHTLAYLLSNGEIDDQDLMSLISREEFNYGSKPAHDTHQLSYG
jgi:hypothetical protein